ncbi:hypothetical protein PR048_019682 [Dryococelus australis]|uniref:Uncharacterized protein n=1 Tax=Dryococelus australis TaxID=614101 RepID=A0ABQ9H461_9NEOP|nr:hypothetical protein PR048_019682 [Dryococelus australis]
MDGVNHQAILAEAGSKATPYHRDGQTDLVASRLYDGCVSAPEHRHRLAEMSDSNGDPFALLQKTPTRRAEVQMSRTLASADLSAVQSTSVRGQHAAATRITAVAFFASPSPRNNAGSSQLHEPTCTRSSISRRRTGLALRVESPCTLDNINSGDLGAACGCVLERMSRGADRTLKPQRAKSRTTTLRVWRTLIPSSPTARYLSVAPAEEAYFLTTTETSCFHPTSECRSFRSSRRIANKPGWTPSRREAVQTFKLTHNYYLVNAWIDTASDSELARIAGGRQVCEISQRRAVPGRFRTSPPLGNTRPRLEQSRQRERQVPAMRPEPSGYTAHLPPWRIEFNPRPSHSGISQVVIVSDDAAGRLVYSGISRFPRPCIPALLFSRLISPSSYTQTSSLTPKNGIAQAGLTTNCRTLQSAVRQSSVGFVVHQLKVTHNYPSSVDPSGQEIFSVTTQQHGLSRTERKIKRFDPLLIYQGRRSLVAVTCYCNFVGRQLSTRPVKMRERAVGVCIHLIQALMTN